MTDSLRLSVIVPAYNEALRIESTLNRLKDYLGAQDYLFEIIVSDDGSSDDTIEIAERILKGVPHKILTVPKNRGKGHAVKTGMLEASGTYVLFSDADLSTPIEEIERVFPEFETHDIVIGSRALRESRLIKRQPIWREIMGKVFNKLARSLTFKGINDSQCGFKCFKSKASRDLFSRQRLDGFSFDVEIVYLAQKSGYSIKELPVAWVNSPESRVQAIRDSFLMFADLIKIRWLHRK